MKDSIRIIENLLEGVKELNGEHQSGWDEVIRDGEHLLEHLKDHKDD